MRRSSLRHLHRRLRWQLAFYLLLTLIFCGLSVYHTIIEDVSAAYALSGFFCGGLIGVVFSRIQHISWDHEAQCVIGRFDAVGFGLLIVYIIFEIMRTRIVELFTHGPSVIVTSFAILAGVMIGRVLGIRGEIHDVLRDKKAI